MQKKHTIMSIQKERASAIGNSEDSMCDTMAITANLVEDRPFWQNLDTEVKVTKVRSERLQPGHCECKTERESQQPGRRGSIRYEQRGGRRMQRVNRSTD